MTHGYTFGYRRRLTPTKAADGTLQLILPSSLLDFIGVNEDEQILWTLAEDGTTTLRKIAKP